MWGLGSRERREATHLYLRRIVNCFARLATTVEMISRSTVRHMHPGPLAGVPLAVDRPLALRRELQEQAVIGLPGDCLDAERQAVLVGGERGKGKIAP